MDENTIITSTEQAPTLEPTPKRNRSRRRGQNGCIVRRGSGWTIIFRAPDGKQKWESGFRTKEAARTRLHDALGSIRKNTYVERSDMMFRTFSEKWMEDSKPTLKPRTWISYRSALKNWVYPTIGERPISDLRRSDISGLLYGILRDPDISRKFVRNVHALVHRVFEYALENEVVAANPAHRIKLPEPSLEYSATASEGRIVPTPEEVVKTFEKLPSHFQALLLVGAITGARRAELIGLQWEDVDFERHALHIRRSLQRVPKKILDSNEFRGVERIGNTGLAIVSLKSKRAYRRVDLEPKTEKVLRSLRAMQRSESPFVFQTELGGPIDPDSVDGVLKDAQDRAEVRHFGLHGLRHLYATLLHEHGATVKFAQERLGHANASTTLNVYTHALDSEGSKYARKVASAFDLANVSLTLAKPPVAGAA